MSSYFPNRWPLSYLNLTKNMQTYIRRKQHRNIFAVRCKGTRRFVRFRVTGHELIRPIIVTRLSKQNLLYPGRETIILHILFVLLTYFPAKKKVISLRKKFKRKQTRNDEHLVTLVLCRKRRATTAQANTSQFYQNNLYYHIFSLQQDCNKCLLNFLILFYSPKSKNNRTKLRLSGQ